MADIKKSLKSAADKVAETAKSVGHKISEGAEKATDWVKEKAHEVGHRADESAQQAGHAAPQGLRFIQEHMEVIASCGTRIGKVDQVQGNTIKLTKNDPQAGGQHHFIPLDWVARVDQHVHLNRDSEDVMREWRADPTGAM